MRAMLAFLLVAIAALAYGQTGTLPFRPAEFVPTFQPNQNIAVQYDHEGSAHNVFTMDMDFTQTVGSIDPRVNLTSLAPLNLFRRHVHSAFEEIGLDPRWDSRVVNGGEYALRQGFLWCRSNKPPREVWEPGSGCEFKMPNTPVHWVVGQRLYFYIRTYPAGNLAVDFGVADGEGNTLSFARSEGDAAQPYRAVATLGGVKAERATGIPGDDVRRLFCIEILSKTQVNFWAGNTGGQLSLQATLDVPLPERGEAYPFIRFYSGAPRDLMVDDVYLVLVK